MQSARSRRWLLALGAGLLLATAVGLAVFWPRRSTDHAPQAGPAAETTAAVPDAAPAAQDASASAPRDAGVDRPRRRTTHQIGDGELRRITRRHGGLLRACVHRAVRKGVHQVPGKITVELRLAAGGRVQSVKVSGALGAGLRDCVRRSLLGWRFPRNAKAQTLRFPIVMAR